MPSKASTRQQELLRDLGEARQAILEAARELPPEKRTRVFLGTWSAEDLLAHLIGWDVTNLEAVQSILRGEVPAFYAFHDRDWQSFNARLVERFRQDDFDSLLAIAEDSSALLREYLRELPAEAFAANFGVRWKGMRVTVEKLLRVEAEDEFIHARQLQDLLDS